MLFDYRKQTDVVSLDGVISWLETKNPDEEYDFSDCHGACLFSQYLSDRLGVEKAAPYKLGKEIRDAWGMLHSSFWFIAGGWPYAFGDALKRARKLQAEAYAK